jgi:Flp pilus assembly protein TadB
VLGYHVTGSTGRLFLCGIVVGAVGLFGLSLLLAGARRTARRGRTARRELKQSRRETAAANQDRQGVAHARQRKSADANKDADADHPERAPELAETTIQPGPTATPGKPAADTKTPSTLTRPARTRGTVMSAPGSPEVAPGTTGTADSTVSHLKRDDSPQGTVPATPTQSTPGTRQTPEGRRLTQRISLLLGQRTSFSQVMLVVLSAALILGLIGFAAHALWVVAIIVIALGLGYIAANSRRDRTDAVNQRQEDDLDTARRG